MSPPRASLRDRVQLRLLRMLSVSLALIDSLLGVSWGERLLERLAARWQARLAQIDADLAALEREREMVRHAGPEAAGWLCEGSKMVEEFL